MKLSLLLFSLSSATLAQTERPLPPGIRQAEQNEAQVEKNIPPPMVQRSHTDFARMEQEAEELSKTAQTIPSDVDQIAKGVLPKDVIEKLKQIEKLSKHLRRELNP